MDYLRCMEFPLTFGQISLKPGMRILDLASPQWFSLFVAHRHPDVEITYANILESELREIRDTARSLGLSNIRYVVEDGRRLSFESGTFDRVWSISTIEHIPPAEDGDLITLREIHRVLKPRGELTLSVPMHEKRSLVYDDVHAVWDRPAGEHNFYMRNYDPKQLETLIRQAGFDLKTRTLMYERPGFLAMDYWEGGPGKKRKAKDWVVKFKKKIDKWSGLRLEGFLARRYLVAGTPSSPRDRLINSVATLAKGRP
jgi:ubiquinone/menaquinone biosynthesis C-methylase UbiE